MMRASETLAPQALSNKPSVGRPLSLFDAGPSAGSASSTRAITASEGTAVAVDARSAATRLRPNPAIRRAEAPSAIRLIVRSGGGVRMIGELSQEAQPHGA